MNTMNVQKYLLGWFWILGVLVCSEVSSDQIIQRDKVKCPFSVKALNPLEIANLASETLLPDGRIREAFQCTSLALKHMTGKGKKGKIWKYPENIVSSVSQNADIMRQILAPKHIFTAKRIYHNFRGLGADFPINSSDPLPLQSQNGIAVSDDALTRSQCAELIALFDQSDHGMKYDGNVMRGGEIIVDKSHKKAKEIDITGTSVSANNATLKAFDEFLLGRMLKYLRLYEVMLIS